MMYITHLQQNDTRYCSSWYTPDNHKYNVYDMYHNNTTYRTQ
jgi:hypothetical protein